MDILHHKILMATHKIEKALSMPSRWPVFAQNVVRELFGLLASTELDNEKEWLKSAYFTLERYFDVMDATIPENKFFLREQASNIQQMDQVCRSYKKQIEVNGLSLKASKEYADLFEKMVRSRQSVRNFSDKIVPMELLNKALLLAHRMPSACNRQSAQFHLVSNSEKRSALLKIHCGNAGFEAPVLGVLTTDRNAYLQADEENAPYFEGGLFCGGLVLALESLGLSSCLLNWHVSKEDDVKTRELLEFADNLLITNLIYIGFHVTGMAEANSMKIVSNLIHEI